MKPSLHLAAFVLPVFGLGALWGVSEYESHQGTIWEVPVAGYDPRDLLRGHYVQFAYDWPGLEDGDPPERICISRGADGMAIAARIEGDFGDCEFPAEADPGSVYGNNSLIRGRFYVGQDRALELERRMRDRDVRAIVKIRLGENKRITPQDITFRPLTDAELLERDGPDDIEDAEGPEGGDASATSVPDLGE